MQRLLVIFQLAVSLVLLLGAMLFLRSFRNLITFDPGMREAGISVAYVALPQALHGSQEYENLLQGVLQETRSVPGVLSGATTTNVPLTGGSWEHAVRVGSAEGLSKFTWVSADYFKTMNIPLVLGRDFNSENTSGSPRVAVVNREFVRRYLKGADPLGKTLRTIAENHYPSTIHRIVGVIPDTKYNDVRSATPPMAFAPASQYPDPGPFVTLVIHSNTPEPELMSELKQSLERRYPGAVVTGGNLQAAIRDGMVRERVMATLSGVFGAIAALLAIIGLLWRDLLPGGQPQAGDWRPPGHGRHQVAGGSHGHARSWAAPCRGQRFADCLVAGCWTKRRLLALRVEALRPADPARRYRDAGHSLSSRQLRSGTECGQAGPHDRAALRVAGYLRRAGS